MGHDYFFNSYIAINKLVSREFQLGTIKNKIKKLH